MYLCLNNLKLVCTKCPLYKICDLPPLLSKKSARIIFVSRLAYVGMYVQIYLKKCANHAIDPFHERTYAASSLF
jgi:hypothetical protein